MPLATLDDLVFGAWDPFPDDAYVAAQRAGVLEAGRHLEAVAEALRAVRPMKAAFDPRVREAPRRAEREADIEQAGHARGDPRGHQHASATSTSSIVS